MKELNKANTQSRINVNNTWYEWVREDSSLNQEKYVNRRDKEQSRKRWLEFRRKRL